MQGDYAGSAHQELYRQEKAAEQRRNALKGQPNTVEDNEGYLVGGLFNLATLFSHTKSGSSSTNKIASNKSKECEKNLSTQFFKTRLEYSDALEQCIKKPSDQLSSVKFKQGN